MSEDLERVEYIDEYGQELTTWECDFLDSILKLLRRGRKLTDRQRATLEKIEEQRLPC